MQTWKWAEIRGEKRLGALVLRLTSEVGAHNKIQSDRTNHRSPTGEIGGFDWTYGNWLSNDPCLG